MTFIGMADAALIFEHGGILIMEAGIKTEIISKMFDKVRYRTYSCYNNPRWK